MPVSLTVNHHHDAAVDIITPANAVQLRQAVMDNILNPPLEQVLLSGKRMANKIKRGESGEMRGI
ncbi:hypothetical protein SS12_20410 [Enterobacter hormaechei subsp. hoffmannii]|nr:hypothetical protein SS12_20410 [Enterobacter hormaechei subsp. hoffmannii]